MREVMRDRVMRYGDFTVVHGAAPGADTIAEEVALEFLAYAEPHPADWETHGKAAGPLRNQEMLDSGIDGVIAFKDGFDLSMGKGGTEDMCRRALRAGKPVTLVSAASGVAGQALKRPEHDS